MRRTGLIFTLMRRLAPISISPGETALSCARSAPSSRMCQVRLVSGARSSAATSRRTSDSSISVCVAVAQIAHQLGEREFHLILHLADQLVLAHSDMVER